MSLSLSHWYPGSSGVFNCIDSGSLYPYLLLHNHFTENSSLDDRNAIICVNLDLPNFTLDFVSVSANEEEAVLNSYKLVKLLVLVLSMISFLKN